MSETPNVFEDEWDEGFPPTDGFRQSVRRLIAPGNNLGMSLYELPPGQTQCPYHFHHGSDELLLVLRGQPTLRTPDGERRLNVGDVVHFPRGSSGAHRMRNTSQEPVRYVVASASVSPEVVEYPDSGKVAAFARGESQLGRPLWSMHRLEDAVDYFDGESPGS
jgi:uncharacterized cupin superfamily protein